MLQQWQKYIENNKEKLREKIRNLKVKKLASISNIF